MRQTQDFVFFFTKYDIYSNWYPCQFQINGVSYSCVEQAMMHAKAMLFSDHATADKIMATADPKIQKSRGREVSPYDDNAWCQVREEVVYQACRAKFTQNPQLLNQILSTGTRQFVEASPYDRIWGIGLAHTDHRAEDPSQWKGQNLLGKALTRLRDDLVLEQSATCRPRPSP